MLCFHFSDVELMPGICMVENLSGERRNPTVDRKHVWQQVQIGRQKYSSVFGGEGGMKRSQLSFTRTQPVITTPTYIPA